MERIYTEDPDSGIYWNELNDQDKIDFFPDEAIRKLFDELNPMVNI